MQLCSECGADVAETGHLPRCPLIYRETDPRYEGLDELQAEARKSRVTKTPKTPNPDNLPDGPTSISWAKGRPA